MKRKIDEPYRQMRSQGGLDVLIAEATIPQELLDLENICLPQQQPRRYFDPQKMQQLTESVKEHGILEPLLVRPLQNKQYELVAGERRYRAAREAGLNEVPVVIRNLTDEEALQLALVENLQREDLNPVEETEGILQLLALKLDCMVSEIPAFLYQMKHAVDKGSKVGNNVVPNFDSRQQQQIQAVFQGLGLISWVSFTTHRLPLLNLPTEVLESLRQGYIAYTKARAISTVKDEPQRQNLLKAAISEDLSLTQIKERIAKIKSASTAPADSKSPSLKGRMDEAYRLVKKSKIWDDPKKQKRLEKLLTELEVLAAKGE